VTPDHCPPPDDLNESRIRSDLLDRHGPLLTGQALQRALGYPSAAALRQGVARNTVPVPTFLITGRRGRFARTWDVAHWLARQGRVDAPDSHPEGGMA